MSAVSLWVDAGSGHRVQVLADGEVLWEHPTPEGYQGFPSRIHQVSPREGERWTVVCADPLSLAPSLHCDPALGGCGAHGFVTGGRWQGC